MNQQVEINLFALLGAIVASGNKNITIQKPDGTAETVPALAFDHDAETGAMGCVIPVAEYQHFTTPPGYDVTLQTIEIEGGLPAIRIVFTKAKEPSRILTPDGRAAVAGAVRNALRLVKP